MGKKNYFFLKVFNKNAQMECYQMYKENVEFVGNDDKLNQGECFSPDFYYLCVHLNTDNILQLEAYTEEQQQIERERMKQKKGNR